MATIEDVAKLAKVSTATVSRVLANSKSVSAERKRMVLEAIEQLNYEPNGMARGLRLNRSNIIVALVVNIGNPFPSEVMHGIENTARENGYHVLVGSTYGRNEKKEEYLELIKQSRADGGIILATVGLDIKFLEEVSKQIPLILASEHIPGSAIPSVSIDDESASYKITKHLLSIGHKKIAYIGLNRRIVNVARLNGYKKALNEHEFVVDEHLIEEVNSPSLQSGYEAAKSLLSSKNDFTAIFASTDTLAIGAMKAINERGIRVPEDIAVVGFDDLSVSDFINPSLTTIHQPRYEIGKKSVEMLLKRIQGEELEQCVILEDRLIIRESCGFKKIGSE